MRSSVSKSTAAVASSKTRMRVLRSNARDRHTSCFWPTLRMEASQVGWGGVGVEDGKIGEDVVCVEGLEGVERVMRGWEDM